jgi:hypothetical protein
MALAWFNSTPNQPRHSQRIRLLLDLLGGTGTYLPPRDAAQDTVLSTLQAPDPTEPPSYDGQRRTIERAPFTTQ